MATHSFAAADAFRPYYGLTVQHSNLPPSFMDLLHGFEVLSTTEETLFNSRNVSRLVQNNSGSNEQTMTLSSVNCHLPARVPDYT